VWSYVVTAWFWIHASIGRANFNGFVFTDKLFKQGDTCFDFINQVSLGIRAVFRKVLFDLA